MDTIEQAAKRLEQLRRAGVDVAEPVVSQSPHVAEPLVQATQAVRSVNTEKAVSQSRSVELDMALLALNGVITPNGARSEVAEEMRVIKRPLLANIAGKSAAPIKDANLIMVTSAVPGEGKTTTSINLAMSIAMELDHTVLLVDADVARPSVPGVLGIEPQRGLLDLLLDDKLELGDVLLRTNVEKLSILSAGTQHPRATELLASESMYNLLLNMANRYSDRVIIFDSPPLLVTTEARALATHMGQVVLVVRAESTTHAEVKAAVAALAACPVKMVLLNQATSSFGTGYGYGYGYGYGQADPPRKAE